MADLSISLTTTTTQDGVDKVSISNLVVPDIVGYDNRRMNIPASSEITVMNFTSQNAAGTFINGNVEFLSITNLDAVNYARIRVSKVSTYGFDVRLDPGKFFIMGNTKEYASSVGATFATFVDCDSISMQAISSAVDIEYVVATT